MLDRRCALALLTAVPCIAAAGIADPAFAAPLPATDQALVDRAIAYLSGLTSAKARFVQTDPRGGSSQGTLYLQRPGKARFAYDPPAGLTVVSDGSYVYVSDARLKTFEGYPLKTTPLALFLARDIRLDKGVTVSRVARLDGGFAITAEDARRETRGSITLNFADAPLRLIGWTVADARGSQTRVRLQDLAPAAGLDPKLFVLRDPRPKRGGKP